jgi:hypothetical protein
MKLKETLPPGAMRYPALAAVAFISLIVGSIGWQTREDDATPDLVAPATATMRASVAKAPAALTDQVRAFVAFAKQEFPGESPTARAATGDGMRLLAAAIAARGDSPLWRDRAKRLEEAAGLVGNASDSTLAAKAAHEGLGQAAIWVAGLPRVTSESQALDAAAHSIAPGQPLREQADKVEAFFEAAARALAGAQAHES